MKTIIEDYGDGYYWVCPKCKRMMREVVQKLDGAEIGKSYYICQGCGFYYEGV